MGVNVVIPLTTRGVRASALSLFHAYMCREKKMRNLKDEKRGRNGSRSSGMKEKWHDVFCL
jgi:hypothetical protein